MHHCLLCQKRTVIPIRVRIVISKMDTLAIGDLSADRYPNLSPCDANMFNIVLNVAIVFGI